MLDRDPNDSGSPIVKVTARVAIYNLNTILFRLRMHPVAGEDAGTEKHRDIFELVKALDSRARRGRNEEESLGGTR